MSTTKRIKIRRWREEDLPAIVECHRISYPDYNPANLQDERSFRMQFSAFPEGQCLAETSDGRIIGYATSLIVQLEEEGPTYRYSEITAAGSFSSHNAGGDTLYGADIAVHPDFRSRGLSSRLYAFRIKLLQRLNLRRMIAHGRIPDYPEHAGRMTPQEYVAKVEAGELNDRALNAHLKAGYRVLRVLLDYMDDESSLNFCTMLERTNPDFDLNRRRISAAPMNRPVRRIRVCAAQYFMRPIAGWEDFVTGVEFFAKTASEYHSHFLLFPEFFTAQLLSTIKEEMPGRDAMVRVSGFTEAYIDLMRSTAARYGLMIVAGSHPVLRDGELYNVAHLVSPAGNVYTQDKLHITPTERNAWGIRPGEGLTVFETAYGRIAIQVCYDIEFPEASRLLALGGAEVLFVPFHTDERKAYYRVRYCAHARAVENYLYVVMSGNVGRLDSSNYLLNYGQSAVLTPSDFAFPLLATAGEADPNVEAVVIADLDLTLLHQNREIGSVKPLMDRRVDLYDLRPKSPVRHVRVE